MNKRSPGLILSCLCLVLWLQADWKKDVQDSLGSRKDIQGAYDLLTAQYGVIEASDKPGVSGLLAFLAHKLDDHGAETAWITEFFERYQAQDTLFEYVDGVTRFELIMFLDTWRETYPLVTDISLLQRTDAFDSMLPAQLEIGVEVRNGAFYKISDEERILSGGQWMEGFHILKIPVSSQFDSRGTLSYFLDLKAGDLVIRKPIRLAVTIEEQPSAFETAPRPPAARRPAQKPLEGELALYIGDRLIFSSRKLPAFTPPPAEIKITPPLPQGTKPFMLPPKDDPFAHSVSIFDAVGLTYKAIRDIFKKKPPEKSPNPYRRQDQMTVVFQRQHPEGGEVTIQATVNLKAEEAVALRD